jgi:hypothetical protein
LDIDLTFRNATPSQIFAILNTLNTSQAAVLASSPTRTTAAATSTQLAACIARLRARPFKNLDAVRIIDEWQRLRESGESVSYAELAQRCGNGARQGFGQTVATVERAARAIFGVPLFAREQRRATDKIETFYAANPRITDDSNPLLTEKEEAFALPIGFKW